MSNDYIIRPVYKAFQVLQCLAEARRDLALSEICTRLALPKTTVFRYLYTLCECGFVAHDSHTDRYRVGLRLWELAQLAHEPLRMRDIALPFMTELRDRFNETVNLGVLDGKEIVYLEIVESRRSLRMQAQLGGRDPIYSTALGKAILAFMSEKQWPSHLPSRLEPRTAHTLTSLNALKQDLLRVRSRGFALDDAENEEDTRCVGAPLFDQAGKVAAAISVSSPSSRLHHPLLPEVTTTVMQTATAISRALGYHPPLASPDP